MKKLSYKLVFLLYAFVLILSPVQPVRAEIIDPLSFPFYDPNSSSCDSGALLAGNDNIEKIYNYLIGKGLTNIQAIGIMANLQAESGFEPRKVEYGFPNSRGEISKNGEPSSLDDNVPPTVNDKGQPGYGLAQWSGGRKDKLKALTLQRNVKGSDLGTQLDHLWAELTTSYENSVLTPIKSMTSLNDVVEIVLKKFEVPADADSKVKDRQALAVALYSKLGGALPPEGAISTSTSSCSVAANGSIIQTAVDLAWPDGGHGKNEADAKPSYQSAMPKYNGATTEDPFSDCGVFVSTVMIMTGADPTYPKRDTTAQLDYLAKSPKYIQVNATSTADLRPGDIFITDGHTYLYVGPQAGGYSAIGAALHDHVPEATGGAYFSDTVGGNTRTYKVYRLK